MASMHYDPFFMLTANVMFLKHKFYLIFLSSIHSHDTSSLAALVLNFSWRNTKLYMHLIENRVISPSNKNPHNQTNTTIFAFNFRRFPGHLKPFGTCATQALNKPLALPNNIQVLVRMLFLPAWNILAHFTLPLAASESSSKTQLLG